MKDEVVVLVSMLGGFSAAALSFVIFFGGSGLNYRGAGYPEWMFPFMSAVGVTYLLGVYGASLWLRQRYPLQSRTFEPSFLVLGSTIGCLFGFLALRNWLSLSSVLLMAASFFSLLLFTRLACLIKYRKGAGRRGTLLRLIVPLLLASVLWRINYNNFPGGASAEIRQQWAYTEFRDYDYVVKSIRSCQPIITRVGDIKAVAPTRGRNFIIYDHGSSGHQGELTLEVVGTKSAGIANFSFHIETNVYLVRFKQKNKTEELACT